jgi:hypothetical protein
MSAVIKPLRRYKKTAWRKKYLTQNQRWGKVTVTKMPVPQGQITSSQGWTTPAEPPLPEEPTEVEEKEEEQDGTD